jgi:ABC-2 type transport system permease protein
MKQAVRTFAVVTGGAARRAVVQPGPLLVSVGFYLIVVAVLAGLWRVAAHANGGTIAGYSAVALTWYIATSEAANLSLNARMIEELGGDISTGSIAVELLRPTSVLALRVGEQVGRAVPRIVVLGGAAVVLSLVTAGGPPSWAAVALAVPSVVLAVACNVVAQHLFAASAFWLRNAGSAWYLYQKLVFVLGGMLIPLELLPRWIEATATVLPFRAMTYAPARLASGHLEPHLLLEQVGWIAVLAALAMAVFAAGERRLQVVGG